jgi:hypothetical protein
MRRVLPPTVSNTRWQRISRAQKRGVTALLSTSLNRDRANEQDSLDGAAIGFQQVSPAVFPLELRLYADLSSGEPPPTPADPDHFVLVWVSHRVELLRIKGAGTPIAHPTPDVQRYTDTWLAAARNSSAPSQARCSGRRTGIARSAPSVSSFLRASARELVVLHA